MLSDGYRVELKAWGIEVVAITPGELRSSFDDTGKAAWHQVLAEATRKSLAPPPTSTASNPTPLTVIPPSLSLSSINHYDRAYLSSRHRPRTIGTADMFTDAVEVALRTRYPLPRYDCGDDGAVSSLIGLMPVRWRDWMLGRWFFVWSKTAEGEDVREEKGEEEDEMTSPAGEMERGKSKDRVMERERKMAAEEEKDKLTESFVIEDSADG